MTDETARQRPPLVLVVEDDDDGRELYVLTLEHAGFLALGACTVTTAREILQALETDVLVAACTLPDGTGADVVRTCPEARRPKTCILLAGDDTVDVDTTGFDVVLKKPLTAAALVEVIRERV